MQYGHHEYVDFTNPDFVKLAESMGAIGYRIQGRQKTSCRHWKSL